jgi:hypothetical protein
MNKFVSYVSSLFVTIACIGVGGINLEIALGGKDISSDEIQNFCLFGIGCIVFGILMGEMND